MGRLRKHEEKSVNDSIIAYLKRGEQSTTRISGFLRMRPAAVRDILTSLFDKGLLTRRMGNGEHGKVYYWKLTDERRNDEQT